MKYLLDTNTTSRYYSYTERKKKFHIPRRCIYSNFNINISYFKSYTRKFLKILYSFFYPMNNAHEHCPNSDPKQCIITKLGCVHSAHTQKPGRAHAALAMPRSWALQRTQPSDREPVAWTASAGRALRVRRPRACWVCTGRDMPRQPAPGQVATSFLGRDLLEH